VRLKDDGTLDLDWRHTRRPWWTQTSEEIYDEIITDFMRAHPKLTREEAEECFKGVL
jgi:hypothetical protein